MQTSDQESQVENEYIEYLAGSHPTVTVNFIKIFYYFA